MKYIYKNARLIDCVEEMVKPGMSVAVNDGRITDILPDDALKELDHEKVVDLQGAYLLPGLWDVHVHPDYISLDVMPLADQMTLFGYKLRAALYESGIVGLRCAGSHSFMDVAWRDAFESKQYIGPKLFASGYFLTTSGGHFLTSGHALECDGPYGFVKAIREQIKGGVDHIKLNLSGGINGPKWDHHTHSFFLPDELKAAIDICHLRGFNIMAHATHPDVVKAALKLGVHSIEHGYILDDECIELLLKHDAWLVPTLAISHLTPRQAKNQWEKDFAEGRGWSHAVCCRAEVASETHSGWFSKAMKAGVKVALGSDIRPLKDAALLEMGLWVRSGATPWQTLIAATRNGAAICGMEDSMGTIEPGKLADMIVVESNPLEDINNLRKLQMVIKGGEIISTRREGKMKSCA